MKDWKKMYRAPIGALALWAVLVAGGCDSLLDVSLPGQLLEEDLDSPGLAETLVISVESQFECTMGAYAMATSLWSGDWFYVGNTRTQHQTALRSAAYITFDGSPCSSTNPPGIWLPVNESRVLANNVAEILRGFTDAEVQNRSRGIAVAEVFSGYSYLLAGEGMCELAFDNGPLVTREQAWEEAREHFTAALTALTGLTDTESRSLANLSRVGRARASLNLGDDAGVLSDAGAVEQGFVRNATTSTATDRRENRIYQISTEANSVSVHPSYQNLTVDGVPDPRVRTFATGQTGFDGVTPVVRQLKYTALDSPIPFASWREAQLMIAEVQGGQTAVGIINALRATHDLPQFNSNDNAVIAAQVREERRRELWLTGHRLGDMLRWGEPFLTGQDPRGDSYGPFTCGFPLPDQERINNPNLN
jgi:hypothetical protein